MATKKFCWVGVLVKRLWEKTHVQEVVISNTVRTFFTYKRKRGQRRRIKSPGLVVIGGHSSSEGHGFEFKHSIHDGHFFTHFCCNN